MVVAVVSCVAQLDNVMAPIAPAATNSKVFMNYVYADVMPKANRTERDRNSCWGL